MGGLIAVIVIFLVITLVFLGAGFLVWRRVLHFAKSIERGIKMVPILIHLPPPSEDIEASSRDEREVVQEQISQAEVLYNLIAGTFQKGWKSKFFGQRHMALEIIASGGMIKFFTSVPVNLVSVVNQAILTAYPTANLEEVEDHNIFNPAGKISGTIGGEIELKKEYGYPIATFTHLRRDAVQAIINGLMSLGEGEGAAVQILLRPAFSGWSKSAEKLADNKRDKKSKSAMPFSVKELAQAPFKVPEQKSDGGGGDSKPLSNLEQSVVDAIEEKTKHPGFEVLIRVMASSANAQRSQALLNNLGASFSLFDAPGLNGFSLKPAKDMESFVTAFIFRFFPPDAKKSILNSVELATLFHLPDAQFTHSTQVQRQYSKQVEAPSRLSPGGFLLGYNNYRGVRRDIRLGDEDRRRHAYMVGQTGTGKSTLLKQLVYQDMLSGRGLAFIDPHGDAAEELLTLVPKSRTEDVIYFSPGETAYPMGLNLFEHHTNDEKDFLIQEAINMLYKLYDPQHQGIIGPIYEHWFRNCALAVMADPAGGSFIDIPKLLIDRQFLDSKLKYVTDPTVLDFWNKEMPKGAASPKQAEIVQWFVSKFGAFASNEIMRNVVGQLKSSFDLRSVMDEGKILIVNISKGRLGELNSMLLGMIFVMKAQAAAMSRATIAEDQRRDFTLYVDEFQNFSTDSFASILSEARKYHLSLVVANQYIAQLDEKVRDAVFGNAGTTVSFRSSPEDADYLSKQFSPAFEARDIVNMPNFNAAAKLIVDGVPTQPFSLSLAPPLGVTNAKLAKALKQLSFAKYAKPRAEVEAEIFKRLESKPAPDPFARRGLGPNAFGPEVGPSLRPSGQPQPPSPSSRSSFLDEWLAKRRQTPATTKAQQPAQPVGSPHNQLSHAQLPPNNHEPKPSPATASKTVPSRPQGSPLPLPPKKRAVEHKDKSAEKEHRTRVLTPPQPKPKLVEEPENRRDPSELENETLTPTIPKPGQSIMPDHPKETSSDQVITTPDTVEPKKSQVVLSHPTAPAPKAEEAKPKPVDNSPHPPAKEADPQKELVDQAELDKRVGDLEVETKIKQKDEPVAKPPKPITPIPELKPGEIYIDEAGIIHQAKEQAKDDQASSVSK